MKINLMGYEVEIKAKQPLLSNRNNERDTKAVINTIICLMWDAASKARYDMANASTDEKKEIYNNYMKLMEKYASQASDEFLNL